ncbi:MAG: general secretion pathway protein GspK [Planctomycetes bacterium]|nr:general secretion pathway protein GspK [Planctomycetota bacterium]
MGTQRTAQRRRDRRQGSALLLALLVLLILLAIMTQLVFGTRSDADVARNDIALTTMDLAAESSLMEVFDRLKTDGESASGASASPTDAAATPQAPANPAAANPGAAQEPASVDSRQDSWGRPQRTTINGIELRIVVQDEDSKLNVLGMLTANKEEAEKAFERVRRVIDAFREGTDADIDPSEARTMAEAMRDYLKDRARQVLPKSHLLSDDEKLPDQGLPISLEEFEVLESFDESMFRDYREPEGRVVHGLGSFLTTWTSVAAGATASTPSGANGAQTPSTGTDPNAASGAADGAAPGTDGTAQAAEDAAAAASGTQSGASPTGQGQNGQNPTGQGQNGANGAATATAKYGVAVNVNTAPAALLKSLIDDRDVSSRFWDKVIEYRNLEEKDKDDDSSSSSSTTATTKDPVYDEFGEELIQRQVFDSLDELREVDGYENLDGGARAQLDQLLTTESQVFSIYITARKATGDDERSRGAALDPDAREDLIANTLTRTIRCVVWRRKSGDNVTIVPIVRWEVLDYIPLVIQDYPDERR